jgi:hypothetical protein
MFIEDQSNYRASSSGAIITAELLPSNNPQKECSIMAEAAVVMDQTSN